MIYYKDEIITYLGAEYTPATDVIHEERDGSYSNEVLDAHGNKFLAFYSKKDYEDNNWSSPFIVSEVKQSEKETLK